MEMKSEGIITLNEYREHLGMPPLQERPIDCELAKCIGPPLAVDVDPKAELRDSIVTRFGSVASFCRKTRLDYNTVKGYLQSKRYKPYLEGKINQAYELTPPERNVDLAKLNELFRKQYPDEWGKGGMRQFVKDHPDFTIYRVTHILKGLPLKNEELVDRFLTIIGYA